MGHILQCVPEIEGSSGGMPIRKIHLLYVEKLTEGTSTVSGPAYGDQKKGGASGEPNFRESLAPWSRREGNINVHWGKRGVGVTGKKKRSCASVKRGRGVDKGKEGRKLMKISETEWR